MTRRIALTILLTVWAAIIWAGLAAWWTARTILLANLDASAVQRALALPGVGGSDGPPAPPAADRFLVIGALHQTLARGPAPEAVDVRPGVLRAEFISLPEGRYRRLTLRLPASGPQGARTIIYSASAAEFDHVLGRLALWLALWGTLAGIVAALAAARIARVALRPLRKAIDVIGTVNEASLDRRVPAEALPAELRPMATQLNRMLARLQVAFEQRRRFLADASHELRTPVAALITTMEVALRRPRPAAEIAGAMEVCLSEARHMRQLVQALLRQVRADGTSPDTVQTFDAARMIGQCAELARPLAGERQVRVVCRGDQRVAVRSDPSRLRSVVMNLMSNAIEYNRPGGTVEIWAQSANGLAEIVVKDDGPGIAGEHLGSLFQPFYRIDAPGDSDGHLGLGLFLVDSHVKAMGGECRVESAPGAGTTFRVRLPAAAEVAELVEVQG